MSTLTPEQETKVMDAMQRMSEYEKTKFVRACIRILNDDPKALRYAELLNKGQISRRQFFDAM